MRCRAWLGLVVFLLPMSETAEGQVTFAAAQVTVCAKEDTGCQLRKAACEGHVEDMKRLLDQNVSMEVKNTRNEIFAGGKYYWFPGSTPIRFAAGCGQAEATELLIKRGANVESTNNIGMTALHGAAWYAFVDTIKILIAHGADVGARDIAGLRPRDTAALNGHTDLDELLPELPCWERLKRVTTSLSFWVVLLLIMPFVVAWTRVSTKSEEELAEDVEASKLSDDSDEEEEVTSVHSDISHEEIFGVKLFARPRISSGAVEVNGVRLSRGAILAAARSLTHCHLVARLFRIGEIFCNLVLPLRFMLELRPLWWFPFLLLSYVLPNVWLTGAPFTEPAVITLAIVRQSVFSIARWRRDTWVFCVMGLARMFILYALYWHFHFPDFNEWPEPSDDWFHNPAGFEILLLMSKNENDIVQVPFYGDVHVFQVRSLWKTAHTCSYVFLLVWTIAMLWLTLRWVIGRTCCGESKANASIQPSDVCNLAELVEEACERADGKTYDHLTVTLFDREINVIAFGLFSTVSLYTYVCLDVGLDLDTALSLLFDEQAVFGPIILAVTSVMSVRQIQARMFCQLWDELWHMAKTGVCSSTLLRFRDNEHGFEAICSLMISAYALPFAIRTPLQAMLGFLTITTSVNACANLNFELIDLEGLATGAEGEQLDDQEMSLFSS